MLRIFKVFVDCREAMEYQSLALDEGLSFGKRLRIRIHCLMCTYCRRFGKQIKLLRGFLGDMADQPCGEHQLPEESKARMKELLKPEDES